MEKEVQQLKINASNIRSILVRRSSDLKKIRSNRKNLERITKEKQKRTLKERREKLSLRDKQHQILEMYKKYIL